MSIAQYRYSNMTQQKAIQTQLKNTNTTKIAIQT